MKKFRVFKHPDNRLIAVKDGFSLPGAIFGCFWLMWHKMWLYGCIALIVSVVVYDIFPSPEGYILGIPYGHKFGIPDVLDICLGLFIGVFGNEWHLSALGKRGFERVATVNADTVDGAKAKYLSKDVDYNF